MNDIKAIKRLALSCVLIVGSLATARAVIIEGFDGLGNFVSVGVTSDGRLKTANDSGEVAQVIVFTTTQPVRSFQGSSPWIVSPNGGSEWTVLQKIGDEWDVNCITGCSGGGGGSTITPSTTTVQTVGQTALAGSVCTEVSSADSDLRARLFCNITAANTWVSLTGGCTDSNGLLVAPGACYSPDSAATTFVGGVHFFSTAPANIAWQEIYKE